MEIIIDTDSANQRVDRFVRKFCKQYPHVTLPEIYKWIRTWLIKVNGRKTKENNKIQEGDIITFHEKFDLGKHKPWAAKNIKDHRKERIKRDEVTQRIIHEDEERLVRNKPAWIVLHESKDHRQDLSMNDYLEEYIQHKNPESTENTTFKPSFGYRLDKDTSGVLIAAKTYNALQYINEIIRDRKVDKWYETIVVWSFPKHLSMKESLHKTFNERFQRAQVVAAKKGKKSSTHAKNIKTREHKTLWTISLVHVKIETGRMHQIRVHLAHAWYPVVGDIVYGNPVINRKLYKECGIKRQLLHCQTYEFVDEQWTKRTFTAPLPTDMQRLQTN